MKLLGVLVLLGSFSALASPTCHELLLRGTIRMHPERFEIVVNPGTQSEKTFYFKKTAELRLAPYVKTSVSGTFTFKHRDPVTGSTVEDFRSVEIDVPDPLNGRGVTYVGKAPCPK